MAHREKKTLIHKVLNTIKKYQLIEAGDILVLGVSGGPDSITMLDILLKIKQEKQIAFDMVVAHVNHMIREEANEDEEFVKKYCRDFQIVEINRTIGTNGFLRRLFYLDNSGVNRNPLLEKILRNAHLYEKLENCRLSVPRAQYYQLEVAVQHRRRNGEIE